MLGFNLIFRVLLLVPLCLLAACSNSLSTRMGESISIVRGFQSSEHAIPAAVFENAQGVACLLYTSDAADE